MTERLIIRNFAGLEEVDIELGRINIFIGPQASGKSVCAKCLYWFKSFLPELISSAAAGQESQVFDNAFLSRLKEYFPNIWRNEEAFLLRYEQAETFIQVSNEYGKLQLTYDSAFHETADNIREKTKEWKKRYLSPRWNDTTLDYLFEEFLKEKKEYLSTKSEDMPYVTQLFVAAGRSFFVAIRSSILAFLVQAPAIDPFLRDFITKYERARKYQPDINNKVVKHLWELAHHILKGQLVVEGEEDYIIAANGRRITIAHASSGQQEAYAMLLLLINLLSDDDETPGGNPHTVYLEEPEAHLFPESQRVLAQLMSTIFHKSVFHIQYVITTHSPYLLASFNNLVYAQQLAETLHDQPDKLKALYQVVPKNQQLALADMRVYGFENGTAHSLIDKESGLLSADLLDSASDVTAEQFGDLMALDPATQPE